MTEEEKIKKEEERKRKEEEFKKTELQLEKVQDELTKKQNLWNNKIEELSTRINNELSSAINESAIAISYRQILLEERTQMYYSMYKSMPRIKLEHKRLFEHYSMNYAIKINGTEKQRLIEADMCQFEHKMSILQNYITFLTETIKNVDNIIYAIKNKVDFYNISGGIE